MNNGYRCLREDTYIETIYDAYEDVTYDVNLEDYVSNMNQVRKNRQWLYCIIGY